MNKLRKTKKKKKYLYMTTLNALQMLTHLILITILQVRKPRHGEVK